MYPMVLNYSTLNLELRNLLHVGNFTYGDFLFAVPNSSGSFRKARRNLEHQKSEERKDIYTFYLQKICVRSVN